jgi:hypothetical protein
VLIFFIFWPNKIRVSPTNIVSSISHPWRHLSSGRRRRTVSCFLPIESR